MVLKYLNKNRTRVEISSDKPIYAVNMDDGYAYLICTQFVERVSVTFISGENKYYSIHSGERS